MNTKYSNITDLSNVPDWLGDPYFFSWFTDHAAYRNFWKMEKIKIKIDIHEHSILAFAFKIIWVKTNVMLL